MEIRLNKGEILRFEGDLRGLGLRCTDGTLWVTQQGDGRDHILKPGDRMEICLKGKVVLQACGKTELRLEKPRPGSLPGRAIQSLGAG